MHASSARWRPACTQITATGLRGLAVAQWGLGDYQGALKTQDRALALSRARADLDGERTALNGTGLDQYSLGNYPEALRNYRLALDVDKASPSEKFQGLVWANIGLVYRYQGKFDEALEAFATSLDLRRKASDAAGGTKMDRPEWGAAHPRNGEIYFTLTNTNSASRPVTAATAFQTSTTAATACGITKRW